jgi:hypothetical protein
MEALFPQGQTAHHQQEDPSDGDLGPLAGLEETLSFETQIELVGAETGEV